MMAVSANPAQGGVVVPRELTWQRKIVAAMLQVLIRVLIRTWRMRWRGGVQCEVTPGPVIFAFWHNRLIVAMAANVDLVREKWPSAGTGAMISASRDGAFLSSLVAPFGIVPIRGSSSRRGAQALLEATTWLEKNYNMAITPDGPRGPAYQVQDGIIQLAQVTGRPIIPVSSYVHPKIRMRSWDRFQIPLPFAVCEMRHGSPIWLRRDASEEERERARLNLEKVMIELTQD
jgi:lysophospholipid acyltransferase (LPLAT)-like uncharacterized protein